MAERKEEYQKIREGIRTQLLEGMDGEVLSRSFSEGESGGLYVLTLRSHCLEDIALAVDMPG